MKKNNKGQSLIDVIFSMGIVVLVLTGVIVLVVSTAKVKRLAFERQKAVELSQLLIENKISDIKNSNFWSETESYRLDADKKGEEINSNFVDYTYDVGYSGCNNDQTCNIIFTIKWGDNQKLSVERLFSRKGI